MPAGIEQVLTQHLQQAGVGIGAALAQEFGPRVGEAIDCIGHQHILDPTGEESRGDIAPVAHGKQEDRDEDEDRGAQYRGDAGQIGRQGVQALVQVVEQVEAEHRQAAIGA